MGNLEHPKSQIAENGDLAPPPYSEVVPEYHSRSATQPGGIPNVSSNTVLTLYRPLPSILDAHYQWRISTIFHLGSITDKRLFAVAVHTGLSGKGPGRPGVILHNGPTDKDPMLAAAGDENGNISSLNSIITLARPSGGASNENYTEIMHAATSSGTATFRFSTETGHKQGVRREDFEWRKSKGDQDKNLVDSPWKCGFKLLRLSNRSGKDANLGDGASQGSTSGGPEVVAIFAWNSNWSVMNPFRIEFRESGQTGELGEKFAVIAIITGLRLWTLKHQGRTSENTIASREAELAGLYPELQTRLTGREINE
ncbi:uncharacterized protein F4807DRAFT_435623 [Annulohypoxylon truncatum]|uniref:uncharacterized protein n=1 Tax=Annulohypoxylon truncatum TaxID=327061 RepID=UPI0020083EC4|nr:uncharacterized protein F4807DRAFT_435623 [Annulohypoxylon truncatum]KAI1207112.1 hypothetical protein F4807DRAFT_435623 [Annulohypoxylon truncatum]